MQTKGLYNFNNKQLKHYDIMFNSFLNDISNYKDLTHYHQNMNSQMLQSFKNKTELLTIENIEKYIDMSEKKALNYDIGKIADKIKERLLN